MDLTGLELAQIKLIEQQLFYYLGRWNDERYRDSLLFCEREKISCKIENLKVQYQNYLIHKPKQDV